MLYVLYKTNSKGSVPKPQPVPSPTPKKPRPENTENGFLAMTNKVRVNRTLPKE